MLPFLTAYDRLGGSSGSIDPLGTLQTYSALADMLLPGITTVTNRSRYLSMLCAALLNVERHQRLPQGAAGLAQRRKAVEPFERLWALACIAAARRDGNQAASDGLRGVTYANRTYDRVESSGIFSCDFNLLKSQSRTGAVGTYWNAMISGDLVDEETGMISAEGRELGNQFPEPPIENKDKQLLANPARARQVTLPLNVLAQWGSHCNLQAAAESESKMLVEALIADSRRECVRSALASMAGLIPETWNVSALRTLRKSLINLPEANRLDLPNVIDSIVATEQFHEAALAVFESLLWWGTEKADGTITDLVNDEGFRESAAKCREKAQNLREFVENGQGKVVEAVKRGLAEFYAQVDRCKSDTDLVKAILQRHHQVQSGKVDGGVPKPDWISPTDNRLLRPAPRFQRTERPRPAKGNSLTHPYRLEQFVYMLRENNALPCIKRAQGGA